MNRSLANFLSSFILNPEARQEFRRLLLSPSQKQMGEYSYCNQGLGASNNETSVGKYCSIASGVVLGPGQHPTSFLTTSPITGGGEHLKHPDPTNPEFLKARDVLSSQSNKPVKVGNDCWIGRNAIVKDGVLIGDGAVVASGAVVTRDVPPYAIVAGVPAKIIRYRFDEGTIKDLLEIKWWDLPAQYISTLPFHDVKKCIELCREYQNLSMN